MADIQIKSEALPEKMGKIFGALGLAQRAGALVCGRELCIETMKKGKAVLAVFPNDISENAEKELLHSFDKSNTPYLALPVGMSELSGHLGKTSSVSCAVISGKSNAGKGFADIIYKLLGTIPEKTHD